MRKPALRPVTKLSAENQCTMILRDHILSGRVKPGARLTEIALAEQLDVARATLRTSLHRLASEGIVVQIPYTGWHVTALTSKDVWELWTLRASLEGLAARLVAESMNDAFLARLTRAMDELVATCRSGNPVNASAADFALHRTIIDLSDHERLKLQYKQVEQQVRFFIVNSNSLLEDNLDEIIAQHQPIIDALISGNGKAAAEEAWNHNQSEGEKLMSSGFITLSAHADSLQSDRTHQSHA